MNVQVLEFYPTGKKGCRVFGSLKVQLPDLKLQLLGIFVSKRKDSWYFSLPCRNGIDKETGKPVRYPLVVFEDPAQHCDLMNSIKAEAVPFIDEYLKNNPEIKITEPVAAPEKEVEPTVKVAHARKTSKFAKK